MLPVSYYENANLVMPEIFEPLVEEKKFNPLSPRLRTVTMEFVEAAALKLLQGNSK